MRSRLRPPRAVLEDIQEEDPAPEPEHSSGGGGGAEGAAPGWGSGDEDAIAAPPPPVPLAIRRAALRARLKESLEVTRQVLGRKGGGGEAWTGAGDDGDGSDAIPAEMGVLEGASPVTQVEQHRPPYTAFPTPLHIPAPPSTHTLPQYVDPSLPPTLWLGTPTPFPGSARLPGEPSFSRRCGLGEGMVLPELERRRGRQGGMSGPSRDTRDATRAGESQQHPHDTVPDAPLRMPRGTLLLHLSHAGGTPHLPGSVLLPGRRGRADRRALLVLPSAPGSRAEAHAVTRFLRQTLATPHAAGDAAGPWRAALLRRSGHAWACAELGTAVVGEGGGQGCEAMEAGPTSLHQACDSEESCQAHGPGNDSTCDKDREEDVTSCASDAGGGRKDVPGDASGFHSSGSASDSPRPSTGLSPSSASPALSDTSASSSAPDASSTFLLPQDASWARHRRQSLLTALGAAVAELARQVGVGCAPRAAALVGAWNAALGVLSAAARVSDREAHATRSLAARLDAGLRAARSAADAGEALCRAAAGADAACAELRGSLEAALAQRDAALQASSLSRQHLAAVELHLTARLRVLSAGAACPPTPPPGAPATSAARLLERIDALEAAARGRAQA